MSFEDHTKGFGSKILKKWGWEAGRGLGLLGEGISQPVLPEIQTPLGAQKKIAILRVSEPSLLTTPQRKTASTSALPKRTNNVKLQTTTSMIDINFEDKHKYEEKLETAELKNEKDAESMHQTTTTCDETMVDRIIQERLVEDCKYIHLDKRSYSCLSSLFVSLQSGSETIEQRINRTNEMQLGGDDNNDDWTVNVLEMLVSMTKLGKRFPISNSDLNQLLSMLNSSSFVPNIEVFTINHSSHKRNRDYDDMRSDNSGDEDNVNEEIRRMEKLQEEYNLQPKLDFSGTPIPFSMLSDKDREDFISLFDKNRIVFTSTSSKRSFAFNHTIRFQNEDQIIRFFVDDKSLLFNELERFIVKFRSVVENYELWWVVYSLFLPAFLFKYYFKFLKNEPSVYTFNDSNINDHHILSDNDGGKDELVPSRMTELYAFILQALYSAKLILRSQILNDFQTEDTEDSNTSVDSDDEYTFYALLEQNLSVEHLIEWNDAFSVFGYRVVTRILAHHLLEIQTFEMIHEFHEYISFLRTNQLISNQCFWYLQFLITKRIAKSMFLTSFSLLFQTSSTYYDPLHVNTKYLLVNQSVNSESSVDVKTNSKNEIKDDENDIKRFEIESEEDEDYDSKRLLQTEIDVKMKELKRILNLLSDYAYSICVSQIGTEMLHILLLCVTPKPSGISSVRSLRPKDIRTLLHKYRKIEYKDYDDLHKKHTTFLEILRYWRPVCNTTSFKSVLKEIRTHLRSLMKYHFSFHYHKKYSKYFRNSFTFDNDEHAESDEEDEKIMLEKRIDNLKVEKAIETHKNQIILRIILSWYQSQILTYQTHNQEYPIYLLWKYFFTHFQYYFDDLISLLTTSKLKALREWTANEIIRFYKSWKDEFVYCDSESCVKYNKTRKSILVIEKTIRIRFYLCLERLLKAISKPTAACK